MNETKLKEMLDKIKANSDTEAQKLIDTAIEKLDKEINLQKVVFNLKQDINLYSVAHGFKLPETLTKLQLLLDKDLDKWAVAGETLSLTNF